MDRVIIASDESECIRKYCELANSDPNFRDYKLFFFKKNGKWIKTFPGGKIWPEVPSSYREALSTALAYNL